MILPLFQIYSGTKIPGRNIFYYIDIQVYFRHFYEKWQTVIF